MPQRPMLIWLVLATAWVCALASGCASSSQDSTTNERNVIGEPGGGSVSGRWRGAYHSYPNVLLLDLTVGTDGKGELKVEKLVQGGGRGSRGPTVATMPATVRLDPGTGVFSLSPGSATQRGGRLAMEIRVPRMDGVHSSSMDTVGGVLQPSRSDSSPHFVLGRGRAGEALVSKAVSVSDRASGLDRVAGRLGSILGGPSSQKIEAWAGEFEREHPKLDPHRTESGRLFAAARPLYADEMMMRHFQTTYDELGQSGRSKFANALRPSNDALRRYSAFGRGFQTEGTYTDDDIMISVLAYRAINSWCSEIENRLSTVPASEGSLLELARLESAGAAPLQTLFPSRRVVLAPQVREAKARIAGPLLDQRCERLLNGSGVATARRIVGWNSENSSLLELATEADRAGWRAALSAKLDELLEQETATWAAKLVNGLPPSLSGLEAGVGSYNQYRSEFAFAWDHARVKAGLRPLIVERDRAIRALMPTLRSRIQDARTKADLEAFVRRYLRAPGDESGQAFALIAAKYREFDVGEAHTRALTYLLLASGARALGDKAMQDAPWTEAMIAGAITELGRSYFVDLAAEELKVAGYGSDAREIARTLSEALDLLISSPGRNELVAEKLGALARRLAQSEDEKALAEASTFLAQLHARWLDANER